MSSVNAGLDLLQSASKDQPLPVVHHQDEAHDVIAELVAHVTISEGVTVSGLADVDARTALLLHLAASTAPAEYASSPALMKEWLVRELLERRRVGIARYGTPLQTENGRAALVDLRQELLDASAYSWQDYLEKHDKGRSDRT